MTITFEHIAFGLGALASLFSWSWWLVSRTTRAESDIKAGIAAIQATQAHQHQLNEMKLGHLTERVGRVETTLGGITKVVVFQEGPT